MISLLVYQMHEIDLLDHEHNPPAPLAYLPPNYQNIETFCAQLGCEIILTFEVSQNSLARLSSPVHFPRAI
jgi:hypothetical protein